MVACLQVHLSDSSKIPVVLLANKCDLAVDGFKSKEEMREYCEEKVC